MGLPDWTEGKQQYTEILRLYDNNTRNGAGMHTISTYPGAGEIMAGKIWVWKNPSTLLEDDYILLELDGVSTQQLTWEQCCYESSISRFTPLIPNYYDGGDMGIISVHGPSSFQSELQVRYFRSGAGAVQVVLDITLGVY